MTFFISSIFILLSVVMAFIVKNLLKKSYYYKRNIMLIALALLCLTIGITFLLYVPGTVGCPWDHWRSHCWGHVVFAAIKVNVLIIAILLTLLCFAVSVSNIALIRHEGFSIKNVVGTGLELIFVLATIVIYCMDELVLSSLSSNVNNYLLIDLYRKILGFAYLFIYYLDMVLLGIIVMGYLAARQRPCYDKDFIIIPGCSIRKDGSLLPLLKGRTNRAIKYAWEQEIKCGKKVCFVPSGGQGPGEIMSEGSAMELYLLSHAAEQDEVFSEKNSKNTYENFLFSKKIINELNLEAKVAFSTTNYHVLRCGLLAHSMGMNIEGIASSTKWYFWPNGFAREVIAVFVMTKRIHVYAALMIAIICTLLI